MSNIKFIYPRLGYRDEEKHQHLKEEAQALIGKWKDEIIKMDKSMELDLNNLEYDHREQDGTLISRKSLSGIHYIVNHWPKNRKRQVVVQAGGSLGIWPGTLSHFFKWVYTFEPAKYVFPILCMNCTEDNIIKMQAALGNITKGVSIIDGGHAASSTINCNGKPFGVDSNFIPTEGNTLMLKLDDLNLPACDAIILDVERFELPILQGARETIKKYKPTFILVEDNRDDVELRSDLHDFLRQNNYEFVIRKSKDNIYKYKGVNDE